MTNNHFRKKDNVQATEADEKRYVGLNIANVSLDIDDDSIREFVKEYVSNEIEDETIEIVREKKKAVVTIIHSLTPEIIREAMVRINFSDCKQKFFGKPLYCRPLEN